MSKSFDAGIRKIAFWVRYLPREGVMGLPYRSKRAAQKDKQSGEVLVRMEGVYVEPRIPKRTAA